MADRYLFFNPNDPHTNPKVAKDYDLAAALAEGGHDVTVFLVENGVLPLRRSVHSKGLEDLLAKGVKVQADEFAVRERGITSDRRVEGVQVTSLEKALDCVADGHKTVWL